MILFLLSFILTLLWFQFKSAYILQMHSGPDPKPIEVNRKPTVLDQTFSELVTATTLLPIWTHRATSYEVQGKHYCSGAMYPLDLSSGPPAGWGPWVDKAVAMSSLLGNAHCPNCEYC